MSILIIKLSNEWKMYTRFYPEKLTKQWETEQNDKI